MPTGTPTASERARAEKGHWTRVAEHWDREAVPEIWADRPPTERDVVIFHDPREDILRRGHEWGYDIDEVGLSSLAGFAAGLAEAEAEGWDGEMPDVATRAYEARRFLLGDRIISWAVPWLDTVGRGYPDWREVAHSDRNLLLALGDEARVAPRLPGREGLHVVGEDSYGPLSPTGEPGGYDRWLGSLWSGALLPDATLRSIAGGSVQTEDDLALLYQFEAKRWRGLAEAHPGSAQLWVDLSDRARETMARLTSDARP